MTMGRTMTAANTGDDGNADADDIDGDHDARDADSPRYETAPVGCLPFATLYTHS